MNIQLSSIQLDVSIQCRAAIDTELVSEYAERMTEGDTFPAVDLFGVESKCWIGDGWHRVLAAKQAGFVDVPATLHTGGRVEALKFALHANTVHGARRTNADKRRAVEIALREFPSLSSRAVAELCGVSHTFIDGIKPQVATVATSPTVTGADGKQYPAHQPRKESNQPDKVVQDTEQGKEEPGQENQKSHQHDPLDDDKAPHANETYSSETMAGLKRYWTRATKAERKEFLTWIAR